MIRSLNTAATGMVAQQFNLDVIANNLSNVNTTGFKAQRAEFQDLLYQSLRAAGAQTQQGATNPQSIQVGLGARYAATAPNFNQGPLLNTNNPLDVAISGEGFLPVQLPDGRQAFTRDGGLKRDANGLLVTNDGYPLDPEITIPASATAISISKSGTVTAKVNGQEEPEVLGNIQLAIFQNPAGLNRVGQNLYLATGASGDPQAVEPGTQGAGLLESAFLEGSNVQIVEEMVRMILAQRAYEINSKAIQTSDDMLSILNNLKR